MSFGSAVDLPWSGARIGFCGPRTSPEDFVWYWHASRSSCGSYKWGSLTAPHSRGNYWSRYDLENEHGREFGEATRRSGYPASAETKACFHVDKPVKVCGLRERQSVDHSPLLPGFVIQGGLWEFHQRGFMMKTNAQLQKDVMAEIKWEPCVTANEIKKKGKWLPTGAA